MKKIATVVCAKCSKTKQLYGIRTEKIGGQWYFTWSFPLKADVADREGYSETVINGAPSTKKEFLGCPYCHSRNMLYCVSCNKINCYNGEERFTCCWCGNSSEVTYGEWGNLAGGGY